MKMPKEKIDAAMFAPCGMNGLVCDKHCYPRCGAWADAGTAYGADAPLRVHAVQQ